jgi:hypothetical protein
MPPPRQSVSQPSSASGFDDRGEGAGRGSGLPPKDAQGPQPSQIRQDMPQSRFEFGSSSSQENRGFNNIWRASDQQRGNDPQQYNERGFGDFLVNLMKGILMGTKVRGTILLQSIVTTIGTVGHIVSNFMVPLELIVEDTEMALLITVMVIETLVIISVIVEGHWSARGSRQNILI